VPAARAVLFGRVVQFVAAWTSAFTWGRYLAIAAVVLMAALGLERGIRNRVEFFQELGRAPPYYAWVCENARDGDLFLTNSGDARFRLETGQPQYVTMKTHPHRPDGVIEWSERVRKADALASADQISCELLEEVSREGVTHLVRQSTMDDPHCPGWRVIYEGGLVDIAGGRP
jgi:hypothetical protein